MTSPKDIVAFLSREAERGTWCTGFQVCLTIDGRSVVDHAYGTDGTGAEIHPDDLFAIYCAGKPLTATVIADLVDRGELSFDDQLGYVIDGALHEELARLTIEQLLSHQAGLWCYPAVAFLAMPPADRARTTRQLAPHDQLTSTISYAEYASWELLKYAIENLTGHSFVDEWRRVQRALRLPGDLYFTLSVDQRSRLRLNADMQTGIPIPLLWERAPSNLDDARPAVGAMASMRSLAGFYARLLERRIQSPSSSLACMLQPAAAPHWDRVLRRRCQFGRGFMVDLALHHFGDGLTTSSFGHSGLSGMTFAGADPSMGVAFAVHLNGITTHELGSQLSDSSPESRRRVIGDLLLDCARQL